VFDLTAATVLLVLALPVLMLSILAIFVESGLPIFFHPGACRSRWAPIQGAQAAVNAAGR